MASPTGDGDGGGGSSSASNDGSNLTFVVTTNPYDATSAANRKQVRSIAALKSWPKRRRRTFEQYAGSASSQGEFIFEQQPSSNDPKPGEEPPKKRPATTTTATARQPKRKRSTPVMRPESSAAAVGQGPSEPPLFEKCSRAANKECSCAHCRFERAISSYPSPDHPQSEPDISRSRSQKKRKSSAEGSRSTTSQDGDRRFMSPPESPTPSVLAAFSSGSRSESFSYYPASNHPWFDRILHHSAPDPANPSPSSVEPEDTADPGK